METDPSSFISVIERHKNRAAYGAILLCLTGCAAPAGRSGASPQAVESSPAPPSVVLLKPDMSRFLLPSDQAKCLNGGARPCAILIRTQPARESKIINAESNQSVVSWPLEAYAGKPADDVPVLCYTNKGQPITSVDGNSVSLVWYEVVVTTDEHVLNPDLKDELSKPNPALAQTQYQDRPAIIGWASVEWFNSNTPDPAVPECQTAP